MKRPICAVTVLAISTAQAGTIFVDDDAPLGGDGLSWNTAYKFLQDALAQASPGGVVEILVAGGVYQPDHDEADPGGTGDREATFQLLDGVAVRGGYAGLGAPDPDARDVGLNEAVLSGDLSGDDLEVTSQCCGWFSLPGCTEPECVEIVCGLNSNCCSNWTSYCSLIAWTACGTTCGADNRAENAYHVVTATATDGTAVLDGFTITKGNANGSAPHDIGAGMFTANGSPTITDCTFRENSAVQGGGMYNLDSNPVLTGCLFVENLTADAFDGDNGAAMYNLGSDPHLTGCTFTNNFGNRWGAAIYNDDSSPVLVQCTFTTNFARLGGAGLCNVNGSAAEFAGCTFTGNWGNAQSGGAITSDGTSHLTVDDCTFTDNFAVSIGGISSGLGNTTTIRNCHFVGNASGSLNHGEAIGGGSVTVTDCTIEDHQVAIGGGSAPDLMQIIDCVFTNNHVSINMGFSADLIVSGCTFTGSSSTIQIEGGTALVTDCLLDNNVNGIGILFSGNLTIEDCVISNCTGRAVIVSIYDPPTTVINTTLIGNDVAANFFYQTTNTSFLNCQFVDNQLVFQFINDDSDVSAINCTFYNNADTIYVLHPPSIVRLRNSIVWESPLDEELVDVAWSNVQSPVPGPGNISFDPLFVDPDNGDLRLQSGSPCIDAGDNTAVPEDIETDLDGNPRFLDVPETSDTGNGDLPVVDMGAYESIGDGCLAVTSQEIVCHADGTTFTVNVEGLNACTGGTTQVTFTASGGAVGELLCFTALVNDDGFCCSTEICVTIPDCTLVGPPSDLDGDGIVDIVDFLALLAAWGSCSDCGTCTADLDGDCAVGMTDLLILLASWGS